MLPPPRRPRQPRQPNPPPHPNPPRPPNPRTGALECFNETFETTVHFLLSKFGENPDWWNDCCIGTLGDNNELPSSDAPLDKKEAAMRRDARNLLKVLRATVRKDRYFVLSDLREHERSSLYRFMPEVVLSLAHALHHRVEPSNEMCQLAIETMSALSARMKAATGAVVETKAGVREGVFLFSGLPSHDKRRLVIRNTGGKLSSLIVDCEYNIPEEIFRFVPHEDGFYSIQSAFDNRVLHFDRIGNEAIREGTMVSLYKDMRSQNQRFAIKYDYESDWSTRFTIHPQLSTSMTLYYDHDLGFLRMTRNQDKAQSFAYRLRPTEN